MSGRKVPVRRWMQGLHRAMPVLLDTSGTILLSGAAGMWNPAAGLASLGLGCFFLNWKFNEDKPSDG